MLLIFYMLFWHFHHSVSPLLPSFLSRYFLNSIQDRLQLEAFFDRGPIQHVPLTILEFVLWVPMTSVGTEQVNEFLQCNWKPHQEEAISEAKRYRELDLVEWRDKRRVPLHRKFVPQQKIIVGGVRNIFKSVYLILINVFSCDLKGSHTHISNLYPLASIVAKLKICFCF